MKRYFFLFLLLAAGTKLAAQNDSTAAVIQKIYNTLGSKDKVERSKYKITPGEIKPGSLGNTTTYKSSISVPGFSNPLFIEGGGATRMFTTSAEFASYSEATKAWEAFNQKMHEAFKGGWTFTEYDEPKEVYRSAKLFQDGSSFLPVIRYRLERHADKFKLVLEITY